VRSPRSSIIQSMSESTSPNLPFNVHRDVHLISQAGNLKYSRPLPWPSWPYALRNLIHYRCLYPTSVKATAIRSQPLLGPRKSSNCCRCSTYAAYHPLCSMYELSVTCRVLVFHQKYISDTEIDWETYMYHIKIYLDGERDYSAIDGPTGPLV
jgi:hypothetical protein